MILLISFDFSLIPCNADFHFQELLHQKKFLIERNLTLSINIHAKEFDEE